MTDSSDPRRPKSSRKKPSREPATLDLKATVIDDGTAHAGAARDTAGPDTLGPDTLGSDTLGPDTLGPDTLGSDTLGPEPLAAETPVGEGGSETTIAAGATPDVILDGTIPGGSPPPAEDVVASPEATLDSGAGTDTLPAGASVEEPWKPDATSSGSSFQDSPTARAPDEAVPPRPHAPERRSSAGAVLGSGLLGGLIGAGLLYGLQAWQGRPAQDDPRLAQLEQRVNALRQQPAPTGQAPANTQALAERIQALETARGDLDQRLQAIQGTAQQAASQAQEALNRPAPEAPQPAPQNEAAITDLGNRLTALDEQVRANAQAATDAAAKAATATQELDRRIVDLDRRLADQDRRFGEAERRFSETERRFTDTDRRFTEQEQRLAALSQQAAQNARNAEAAGQSGTKVVLAGRLNDALTSGTPYADVLDSVRKAGTDASRVAPLEPFAQQGAPTAEALARSFEPVETAILRESRGPAEGWTDRLLRMADRVVTVRPVNDPGSAGVPGLVARIRQALEHGDVTDAAAAWEALPEPSRRLSEDWGRQVKAVAEARQAAQAISSDALATLNRTTQ
ncbi:COG4223 family protein [Microvirga yunnanensis]|uniref:COG4223 family protein n=1 Tax=Microvirga yunnanensis TaxID=2953740 RepID=UPI0021C89717|nr:mitofilin family membrane protein [Microvirga sp. HBU65207]